MGGDDTMQPATKHDTRLTYDDFLLFPDDGQRHELIDGEHYVSPSPSVRHQRLLRRLSTAIDTYLTAHPEAGEVFFAPLDVVLSNYDVVEPDLLVIAADQQDISTEKHVTGPPALVVEILSPGTRKVDEKTKYRLFDRTGVRE
jgi:Uma2 family endonuclease